MAKISDTQIKQLRSIKDWREVRSFLEKTFPDAFVNWNAVACKIGDTLTREYQGKKQQYLVVATSDNKAALLNMKTAVLWKTFSDTPVNSWGEVSLIQFLQISNGIPIGIFTKVKKK